MNGPDYPTGPRRAPRRASRIRLYRKRGWRLPAHAVKVDRTTRWGNPFVAGQPNGLGWGDVRDNDHAVWLYRQWLATPARSVLYEADRHREILRHLPDLTGLDLACWCTAGAACHADVLIELANRPDVAEVAGLLLGGWTAPRTAVEMAVVAGQYGRLTGMSPDEVSRLGSTVVDLAQQIKERTDG